MSTRLERAKQEAEAKIAGLGETSDAFEKFVADTILEKYAQEFLKIVQQNIKDRQVVASGQLETNIRYDVDEQGKNMTITMLDYFDYPNEGVRGIDFSNNAPDSPYSFKKSKGYYAMSPDGRESIKRLIAEGKAKVSDTYKTSKPRGLEGKRKSLIDMQTDNLIYLIRKHGIKRTRYFDDAFDTVFATFAEDMAQAYGYDIGINIRLIGKKK
jgi:hypothetical protein